MLESDWLGGINPFSEIEPDNLAMGNLESGLGRLTGHIGPTEIPV
jgi:hypothetical protein